MQVVVELTDFYLDEGEEILPALKSAIVSEAVQKIRAEIKEKVDAQIGEAVRNAIDSQLSGTIQTLIGNVVASKKIRGRYGKDEVTIEEHIEQMFKSTDGRREFDGKIEQAINKFAASFAEELRKRYDLQFAANIVDKMAKQGLLKDEALTNLLSNG